MEPFNLLQKHPTTKALVLEHSQNSRVFEHQAHTVISRGNGMVFPILTGN